MDLAIGLSLPRRSRRLRASPLAALLPVSLAVFGVRLLNPAYAGPCLRVRRASDNGLADIGFASGWLDVAALIAFAGAGAAYVVTWYDQSGTGRHVAHATAAAQPRLVNAGVLEAAPNGRPWLVFAGAQFLEGGGLGDWPAGASESAYLAVARCVDTVTFRALASYGGTGAGTGRQIGAADGSTGGIVGITGATAAAGNTLLMSSAVGNFGAGSISVSWNGAAASSAAAPNTSSPSRLRIGASTNAGSFWSGGIAEVAVFSRRLTADETARLRANHQMAWGTA